MSKCSINNESLKQIRKEFASVFRTSIREHWQIQMLKNNFRELLNKITKDYEYNPSIAQVISETADRYKVSEQVEGYFNVENINNLLIESNQDIQQINELQTSTEQLTDQQQIRNRLDASKYFMNKSYGIADEVRTFYENIINQNLFDRLFVNRFLDDQKPGIVKTNSELNDNIRKYQTQLLKNITSYLRTIFRSSDRIQLDNDIKDAIQNPILYDSDNNYTGILELLQPIINTYIKEPLFGNADIIRQMYSDSKDPKSENFRRSKQKLLAFNSAILLENFDTYLSSVFGKSLQIKDFNQKTGKDKYQISEKTANIAKTWRVSENIFPENEADAITKLAINTTPLYNYGSDTPKEGYYLNFQDFQYTIGKIKDLAFNPISSEIILDRQFESKYGNIPKEIKGKSFRTLIAYIRRNPRKYIHHIFNILSNQEFKQSYPELYKGFTSDELNKLYSLSIGIFNGNNSIRNLCKNPKDIDYYSYITQSSDSIFNVKYLQYYVDENEQGCVRTLLDQGINNVKRKIEQTINVSNSIKLIKDWKSYKELFKIQDKDLDKFKYLEFTIPDTNIKIRVSASSGSVTITGISNYSQDFSKILPFIDDILHLNLQNNIDLLNSLREQYYSDSELAKSLLSFSSRVLLNKYVSKQFLDDLPTNSRQDIIQKIYGKNSPLYNWNLDELGMIHGTDVITLNKIALAKSNLDGIITSTQVKDSEGNGQSNQTLSRLLGSVVSQFELQENSKNSITNSFQLLTNPEILEGIYTTKEFYDSSTQNKQTTKMNVFEMAYSQIVYDFVGGLIKKSNGVVGNGHILILPSVNSDKGTIGRLKINLNIKVLVNGEYKKLIDLSSSELESVISDEFGNFYERMYDKIVSDWSVLEDFIESQGIHIGKWLSSDFLYGFYNFNYNFQSLNTGYKTPADFIKFYILKYNKIHPLHPLEIVDQVHCKYNKDGSIAMNKSIIAQIARFKPYSHIFNGNNALSSYETANDFWVLKKSEVLKGLLKSEFEINIYGNDSEELEYIKNNYKNWINKSGKAILAKLNIDGNIINITSNTDFAKLGITDSINSFIDQHRNNLQLNPILERYNYFDYLISQEFINLTVGSFVAHPLKGKVSNVIEQEAAQFQAQHKRNVSFTAAMHEFQLNQLNGIPEYYNIAVIEDIHDYQGTIIGLENDIKPFDGATFVNPFVVILENNSLNGAKAGISKKQFVHFKNESTGTGGIIKTAGFGLTNDWIRNSPFLYRMMKKMTNRVWLTEQETPFVTDITKDWEGNKINYKKFFFKQNNKYYQIVNIKNLGNNKYQRLIQQVTLDGNSIGDAFIETETIDGTTIEKTFEINTNYRLWNFFGGKNSLELKNNKLQPSNTSVENVVIAMNNIGTRKNSTIETQDDIWQALKMSDVHYVATAGAVKQGAANINSVEKYNSYSYDDPNYDPDGANYDIQRIHMYQAGIQLDKEHHADESDLSLMTQVISACAAKGYTIDVAIGLYEALRKSNDINLKPQLQAIKKLFTEGSEQSFDDFHEIVMKSMIKALYTSNGDNFAKNVAMDLIEQAKAGKSIKFADANIPMSDNTIYRKIFSTVSTYINRTGIKLKIPGILCVLTPSYNIMKLYAGRKYESFNNPEEELKQLQSQQMPIYNSDDPTTNIANVELGRTYFITYNTKEYAQDENGILQEIITQKTEPKLIRTPDDYFKLKQDVRDGIVTNVVENVIAGRDLAGYNVRFKTDKGQYQLWDLDSASNLFRLNELENNWVGDDGDVEKLQNIINQSYITPITITPDNAYQYLESTKNILYRRLQNDLCNLSKTTQDVLNQYSILINSKQNNKEWYKKYTNWVNVKLNRSDGDELIINGNKVIVDESNFDEINRSVIDILNKTKQVKINGEYHTVDLNSIKHFAYEIIMPKIFATKFGLSEFSDLNAISNDRDYFVKQFLRNQTTKVLSNQYTIEFKKSNGDHLYLLNKDAIKGSKLVKLYGIITTTDDSGKTYRIDSNGNTMYQITPDTEIYLDQATNTEVIVSDDTEHYIEELNYDSVKLSENLINNYDELKDICNLLLSSQNKIAKNYGKYITQDGMSKGNIMKNQSSYYIVNLNNYKDFPESNPIIKQGREKHTSFLRSLDIIASRTPSQSMQSYMPMKVVAFDNPDINTAYVSTYQILLQGSDYDVDAVSLATFDIDSNGMLQLWSPYANITNSEMREASEQLPLPNGQEIQTVQSNDLDKCLIPFTKYRDLFIISPKKIYDKKTKTTIDSKTELDVVLDLDSSEKIKRISQLLNELKYISIPNNNYIPQFYKSLQNVGISISKNKECFNSLFNGLKNIIDNHNLYLDRVNINKLSNIINNATMKGMFDSIIDPVNLIEGQTSVDGTTGPLKREGDKSSEGAELKNRTPGNFVNKLQSIVENQIGKEAIGICAIGLKAFFGLTQYNNYILNHGTQEQQERLLIGKDHDGYIINGKTYRTLANIRSGDPNTILNMRVLDALSRVTTDRDAAIVLSALLSLATDNAKELQLSKLNANTKMVGLYIYGITIGMDFRDIANILMSPTGNVISQLLEGNVFTGNKELTEVTKVFKYFDKFPVDLFKKYDVHQIIGNHRMQISPADQFQKKFLNEFGGDTIYSAIANFAKSLDYTLSEKLNILEQFRQEYKSKIPYSRIIYNQLVDEIEKYVVTLSKVNFDTLNDIKILSEGAKELKTLGAIYSLNQGVKTDPEGLLRQVNYIERAIYDKTNDVNDIIDIVKFAFDEQYRLEQIEKYEQYKHSFNILEATTTAPHFMSYIQDLALAYQEVSLSFKFRSSKNLALKASKYINYNYEQNIIKGIENYIGDFLRKQWFLQNNIQVIIPKGEYAFDDEGNKYLLTQDTPIYLGTDNGSATFKMFMEQRVIPDLKVGRIKPGVNFPLIKDNKFIKDLVNDLSTNTISGNASIIYTLPINMMPRSENEKALFNSYRSEFNKLAKYSYQYITRQYDENGNEIEDISQPLPLLNLFVYYAMIANNWKLSENSLVPILDNFQNTGIINDFHSFEKAYDLSGEILDFDNIEITELLPYIAPKENPYSSYSKYIWVRNKDTHKYQLMTKLTNEELAQLGDEQIPNINNYIYMQSNDTNYFPTSQIQEQEKVFESSYTDGNAQIDYSITYNIASGKILVASKGGKSIDLSKLSQIPTKKENGIKKINKELLDSIIKNEENPCTDA